MIVVGIFGKSQFPQNFSWKETCKEGILDHALQKDIFWIENDDSRSNEVNNLITVNHFAIKFVCIFQTKIVGYHESESNRIFLNLTCEAGLNFEKEKVVLISK